MDLEKPEALELDPEYRIRGCLNLDELYYVLRDLGEIKGSRQTYTADAVIKHIVSAAYLHQHDVALGAEAELMQVTNTLGIRDKAKELIAKLPIDTFYSRKE